MDSTRGHKSLTWRTALSCNGGACVQVAAAEHGILLGSSRQPGDPVLSYTRDEWREFVAGIKKGDFDDMIKNGALRSAQMLTRRETLMSEKRIKLAHWEKALVGIVVAASAAATWMHVPSAPPPMPNPACTQIVNVPIIQQVDRKVLHA